ncbi:uncharacterized protein LOC134245633 isoform X2 [Saccostrea cucullata]|uniref:uncharacterized protein LOC134245633 isoform X2 n=1 Tax=Saccostrea cuccullata TaxID=36930 RepID=UPI002ED1366A
MLMSCMFASGCRSDSDCSSECQEGLHPHCSNYHHKSSCHCYVCTEDSHCPCKEGETGKCLKDDGHHRYCQCQAPSCSVNRDCQCHENGKHPYCSDHLHVCHCYDCTRDSHCHCKAGESGSCERDRSDHHLYCHCHATTSTSTTTTSTTPSSTTTILPPVQLKCSNHKISIIESIAENVHVEDNRAALCPSNSKHQSSDAYVINKCNSTERASWMRGPSVKSSCKSILPYTPISTFFDNKINMAGFFIDCTDTGTELKIAAQTCSEPPMIFTLDETTTPRMSDFYTIQQWKPS